MTTEQFNWIHGNAAAYRIWWYELGDEEEEGRGGKGTKLAIDNAETATIKIAIDLNNDAAIKEFAEKVEQAQEQQESMKDLPTLEMDPSKAETTVEVTVVEWAMQQAQSDSPLAKQVRVNNDGTVSVSAQAVTALAQTFPQLAQQNGGAAGMYNQLSASTANTASVTAAAPVSTQTQASTAAQTSTASNTAAATASNNSPATSQSTTAQVSAQMDSIVQKTAGIAAIAIAASLPSGAEAFPRTSQTASLKVGM